MRVRGCRIAASLTVALFAASLAKADPSTDARTPPTKSEANTVTSLTVEGRKVPSRSCGARDDACVAAVVAELKARYPTQLQKWCDHVQERAAMTDLMFARAADSSSDGHPHENPVPYLPPSVTKAACHTDKK